MCSSASVFLVNLVILGSFIPTYVTVVRISSEKGAKPASSVLVPSRTCPATLAERASTYHWRAATISIGCSGVIASGAGVSCQLCCPVTGSFSIRTGGVWV
ncbi:hypothetical protein LIER_35495 [Lithospermum erythrorhizon]|uniref:Secreted protein n=1 Tax=Lithospermum erythrorhizon TaxID=34254 RepID=A0AAV3NT42_LITER